jgi:hypothetical protein
MKFPVFFPVTGNFPAERGSHRTASSAKQSSIFKFSTGRSKILRTFAHFLLPKGTGEAYILPLAADLCSILSVENRAGALSPHRLPKKRIRPSIAFRKEIRLSLSARMT